MIPTFGRKRKVLFIVKNDGAGDSSTDSGNGSQSRKMEAT